ncbi:MAG: PQQ-binding-like beta-propeller repeat protein [Planctomycetota bacterium]|nr:PQQ-binding-like beta-propeller repeat protein [Planctomycetota bacterium]MDA1211531.1 PQQ-binding-like beta-propeller repeat protein [Planctomycetota bacterium]
MPNSDISSKIATSCKRFVIFVLMAMTSPPLTNDSHADDWPQWRGPRRDAVSRETCLQHEWGPHGPPLAWHTQGLGRAYAGVVISEGLVVTQGSQGQDLVATALDAATGELRWTRIIGSTSRMPSSTPLVDGDRLYILDPDGELVAMELATGKPLWQVSFLNDFAGVMMSGRGYGETPLIDGDRLICTPGGPEAMMVALNKYTGESIWKAAIPPLGPKGRDAHGFASMMVTEVAGVRQYVQLAGRGVIGIAAEDGRFLWGYNDICASVVNIPSPVVAGDLVFSANGYNAGSVLLKIVPDETSKDTDGKPTFTAQEVYRLSGNEFQNHHGGVLQIGDHIYGGHGSNNGFPTCLELNTGKILWKRRGPGVGSAAVLAADGHLIFRYQDGIVADLEAGPDGFRITGKLQIPGAGGDSWAHPSISQGLLYLREKDHLWVYNLRKDAASQLAIVHEEIPESLRVAVKQLRMRQAAVSVLSTDDNTTRIDSLQKMYRFTIDTTDAGKPTLVIVLTAQHVTDEGNISAEMLDILRDIDTPVVVSLAGTKIGEKGFEQLATIKNLYGLNLESCLAVNDAALIDVAKCSELRTLILIGTSVTGEGITYLTSLPNLVALDCESCDKIDDVSCSALAQLTSLKALRLKKTAFEPTNVTDAGLSRLTALKRLEWLDLYANGVTDAGLESLKELQELRDLNLSLMGYSDAGLAHLASLPKLEHLEVLYNDGFAGPMLTDAGVMPLSRLEQLRSLNLTGAKITDATLTSLGTLAHLQLLQIVNTRTTPSAIAEFQKQHPECTITHGESTPVVDTGD